MVLLACDGPSTRIVYHALARSCPDLAVIVEDPLPKATFLKRRARKVGWPTAVSQAVFVGGVVPVLSAMSRGRRREIILRNGFDTSELPGSKVGVPSVNSEQARQALRALEPRVVVVNGTRIIGPETLRCVDAPFVNMHAGITPAFRGTHGGYWALAQGRPDLAGTTVHLVDEGIDTGGILAQGVFEPGAGDNFSTYPYLHLEVGVPLLVAAVGHVLEGSALPQPSLAGELPSRLVMHPTVTQYLITRATRGVA